MNPTLAQLFLKELEAEEGATRKCLERIPENLFTWKPHDKSMTLGYLALLVADIPKWLSAIANEGTIDLAAWEKYNPISTTDLVQRYDNNIAGAKHALKTVSDSALLEQIFYLKSGEQVLMQSLKGDSIGSSLNHWVHHRGQLTVYMRLNNIAVPSIYGPSADEKTF